MLVPTWGPLSGEAVFAASSDPIASADISRVGAAATARQLASLSEAELRRTLMDSPPDPLVFKYWHLPPRERFEAAAKEGQ